MGNCLLRCLVGKNGQDEFSPTFDDLHKIGPIQMLDGTEVPTMGKLLEGKKLYLIVNVASK